MRRAKYIVPSTRGTMDEKREGGWQGKKKRRGQETRVLLGGNETSERQEDGEQTTQTPDTRHPLEFKTNKSIDE